MDIDEKLILVCPLCGMFSLFSALERNLMSEQPAPPASRPFRVGDRARSFRYAAAGIVTMLRSQHNAWIHALASVVVTVAAVGCRLSRFEWCWIILAIMAVWTAEALNTAFEFLADVASPEFHPLVKCSKDVAAGAVLISAVGAVAIGALVFWPHVVAML